MCFAAGVLRSYSPAARRAEVSQAGGRACLPLRHIRSRLRIFRTRPAGRWRNPQDAMLHGKWWEIFNDPELNSLEDQLNINNQNIKVFFENYMAARAMIREARAQYWPTSQPVRPGTGPGPRATSAIRALRIPGHESTSWTLPLDVSWTPDFFGKIRNEVREAQFGAQVSEADLENERLLEQASLAEFFFEIRGQDALQKSSERHGRGRQKVSRIDPDTL